MNTSVIRRDGSRILYFAYGSNLSRERIRKLKSAVFKTVATLPNHSLEFTFPSERWGGGFVANIFPDSNSNVHGVVWELDSNELELLDNQEGVEQEIYERIEIQVNSGNQTFPCCSYRLTEKSRSVPKDPWKHRPCKSYKNVIVSGAKEHNLPADYVSFLESFPDSGDDGIPLGKVIDSEIIHS